ncbi:hypothetical protein KAFR_0G01150 [Kazachstania africana CBS 2517]|uniref:Thioesterase domain-containing protein n=1 Tax=Kazachstania africana (strain ATCC 22294 / BCRC 22015 / CBS 2517 / CECT 1963 / NBRC 1671 / NRRL Y-8276) TaxID=1071382 RepID=H2AXP8_KAZAF|nr:hypothetical protein KAFR_0G01150 [Kazachstania africana CBS 2517]CCF59148.1 hypothetical protein KAFR_0G01150 [Kazachstania africana CBS 2517]
MPPIFKIANRFVLLPTLGFSLGFVTFLKAWPDESTALSLSDPVHPHFRTGRQSFSLQREDILEKIAKLPLYKQLINDPKVTHSVQSETIPHKHIPYHVGQGQLFGPSKLEIDPLIFRNEDEGTLVVFYHLGKGLSNENKKIHKGILSLLLDEGLCYCGFPLLPSKRGVTARLNLNFHEDIPEDSTIILRAKVSEIKGRKCVIDGTLESLPSKSLFSYFLGKHGTSDTIYCSAHCILVEPKWFKYLNRFNIF